MDPGSEIRDPEKNHPGSLGYKSTGSGSATLIDCWQIKCVQCDFDSVDVNVLTLVWPDTGTGIRYLAYSGTGIRLNVRGRGFYILLLSLSERGDGGGGGGE
jgi:hypothetical protein